MKLGYECLPCLFSQAKNLLEETAISEKRKVKILKKTAIFLSENFSLTRVSTDLGTEMQRFLMEEAENLDPYRRVKEESNVRAEKIFLQTGRLPFKKAVLASIAGNLIDYSLGEVCHDIEGDLRRVLNEKLAKDHSEQLKREIKKSQRILFLADNCGEIIFDKFLLEHMRYKPLFIAAKDTPYANDATVADLKKWGLDKYGRIISTNSNYLGLKESPENFIRLFKNSLVVAKGMGMWEYLSEGRHPNVFHVFRIKCNRVARELSLPKDGNVCMRNC